MSSRRAMSLSSIAISTLALLGAATAPAGAASEIEKVWSFHGGEVAVKAVAGGKLEGVVVTPTTFDECAHRAGEHMWTNMIPQADGSFWGFHQWLFEKSCAANPTLGPTAWRVLQKSNGSRYLLVCFSEPGGPQPAIAASGATSNVSRTCEESDPTAPLPVVVSGNGSASAPPTGGQELISFANTIGLPPASSCVARGTLRIVVHDPKRDPLQKLVVKRGRRTLAVIRGVKRLQHTIVLRGLPSGSYTLKFTAITVLDQTVSGQRRLHSCRRRRAGIRLHLHRRHRRR
jgi:hypothetical protein